MQLDENCDPTRPAWLQLLTVSSSDHETRTRAPIVKPWCWTRWLMS